MKAVWIMLLSCVIVSSGYGAAAFTEKDRPEADVPCDKQFYEYSPTGLVHYDSFADTLSVASGVIEESRKALREAVGSGFINSIGQGALSATQGFTDMVQKKIEEWEDHQIFYNGCVRATEDGVLIPDHGKGKWVLGRNSGDTLEYKDIEEDQTVDASLAHPDFSEGVEFTHISIGGHLHLIPTTRTNICTECINCRQVAENTSERETAPITEEPSH